MVNRNNDGTCSEIALANLDQLSPKIEPKVDAEINELLGASHNNYGVDDGLLDEEDNKPRPPPTVDEKDNEEEPVTRTPRPRRPFDPWKPGERPPQPLPPVDDNSSGVFINYSTKKTIAQGMMDIALLTANASQLRYIMRSPYWDVYHKVNIVLISISIALQIIVGVTLIFIGRFDYKQQESRHRPQMMNNVAVVLIFSITVVNIFIATFGVDDERTTYLRWKAAAEPLGPSVLISRDP